MYIPNRQPRLRSAPARAGFAFAGLLPLLGGQAQAVEFSFLDNEVSGSLDTTLSYGTLWRVQGQDKSNNGHQHQRRQPQLRYRPGFRGLQDHLGPGGDLAQLWRVHPRHGVL